LRGKVLRLQAHTRNYDRGIKTPAVMKTEKNSWVKICLKNFVWLLFFCSWQPLILMRLGR
jgi:hypothetical protein